MAVVMLALTLSCALILGGAWSCDASPTFGLAVEFDGLRTTGLVPASERFQTEALALPHLILYDPDDLTPDLLRHELTHQHQWQALGPYLLPAYLLTGGIPFEDYWGASMWSPPPELRACPLLRVTASPAGGAFSLLPCWRVWRTHAE